MDDLSSPSGGSIATFHTPEQHLPPPPPRTPATTSAAAATSLPTTGKKRSAPSDDDDEALSPNSGGMFGRLMSSVTPSRWKRSRTSLDGMSGSAIKSVNRTPMGSVEGSGGGSGGGSGEGVPGYTSDGVKSSGNKLGKLNLEKKFDGKMPVQQALNTGLAQTHQVNAGVAAGRVQNNGMELPIKKRVRIGGDSNNSAGGNRPLASGFATGGASKSVRIGGATSFVTNSPNHAFTSTPAANNNTASASAPAATNNTPAPKFHMGSASKPKLRDIRSRASTPAGKFTQRSTAGSTPGLLARGGARSATARAGTPGLRGQRLNATAGRLTGTPGGTIAAGRKLSSGATGTVQQRAATRAARKGPILSRATGYRRRPINARSFKPMSRLLTGAYTAKNDNGQASKKSGGQSMMLTDSIVSQIIDQHRNQLFSKEESGERALFGGNAANDNAIENQARTFEEESAGYSAVNNAVPRVRMNRILGSGQTGGRRFGGVEQQSTSMSATAAKATNALGNSMLFGNSTSTSRTRVVLNGGAPLQAAASAAAPILFGKGSTQPLSTATATANAGMLNPSRAVTFGSDTQMEDAIDTSKPFVPYTAATLTPRGTPGLSLTPCKSIQDNVSREAGEEIERLVQSEEWQQEAMKVNFGFDDPNVYTPKKASGRKKARGTPHPKKVTLGMGTPGLMKKADAATTPGGAPYSFMSGGAAASAKVDTPMAFKFGDAKAPTPTAKSPKTSTAPAASTPAAPAGSGWGNTFKSKPGEWKCETCSTKNPKEASNCLACETPNPSGGGNSGSSNMKASASAASTNVAIGAGGFSFGGSSASPALSPAAKSFAPTSPGGTTTAPPSAGGWGDMFNLKPGEWKCPTCACRNSKENAQCAACETPKKDGEKASSAGATPAKAKRGDDKGEDGAGSIGAGGFSFGGSAAAPSSSSGGSVGAGGFSFGGAATATPANTPAKPKRGRDDDDSGAAPSVGFSFGAGAASAPASTTKASSSAGFSFGASASGGDEKKEDPVSAAASSTGGFSFGTAAPASVKKDKGGASIPGFSFGAPPTSEKKDEAAAAEPSSKKTMFSFGKGGSTPSLPVPAGNGATPAAPGAPGFSFGAGSTPAPPKPAGGAPASSSTPSFAFGGNPADGSAAPAAAAPSFAFGAGASTPAAPAASTSTPGSLFGAPPTASSTPAAGASATPAAPAFAFGASASQAAPSTSGGSTFGFGAAGGAAPSLSTPAPSANPPPSGAGFSFGAAGSAPAAPPSIGGFGSTPAPVAGGGGFGFGNASQPAAMAAPAQTTPGTSFAFGGSAPPAAPSAGFGAPPAPSTGGFGFGNASQPAAAPTTPGFAFGGAPAAPNPTPGFAAATPAQGFGANASFGATPSAMAAPAAGASGFSIGTGGAKRTPGRGGRRIVKARRPPANR
eukprot:CAMPEP_0172303438 /NCGR_PEP_ID=MMETSP1058-20130122/4965_1 /TAXON_ID=83371 /ORGANISM="Detonula confervacea, Strain CCMP 353" /LENGTH=1410 /DNA_ID=CAMNT_0013014249 /DNA_START=279 /DNA_END=4511 /DNA_ORIENTATION=-